jgi:hypothetical protein
MRLSHPGTVSNSEEVETVDREWLRSIAVVARSKAWVCGRSLAGNAGFIPTGGIGIIYLSCECCVSSGRGLCYRPIPSPGESYRVCAFGLL